MLARIGILLALAAVAARARRAERRALAAPDRAPRASSSAPTSPPSTPSRGRPPSPGRRTSGATSYDFELATSKTFDERTVVWSTDSRKTPLRVPAVAIPIALPWMTGNPYALYAHVRAHDGVAA